MKKKVIIKKKYKIIYTAMIVFSVLLIVGAGTYAYYQSTITGTASGTIATWSFKANNQTSTMNLNLGSLYPGKTESYNIVLSAVGSALDVYYELMFDETMWNLYWDSAYTRHVGRCYSDYGPSGQYGIIPAGQTKTITLYYTWPYDGGVQSYTGGTKSASITIIGQQYTGFSGTIPMQLLEYSKYYVINSTSGWLDLDDCGR